MTELFVWPCGCKSPSTGGDVVIVCDGCIQETLDAGRFVVVETGPGYRKVLGDFATREEADVLYQQHREPDTSEVSVFILPRLPLPVAMRVEEENPF